jgi:2-polyprenyl-3-methyl-5-hydroxy-6-metoxy-1,4-benzoquinol methylase
VQVILHEGDAICRTSSSHHPLSPTNQDVFDTIIAIDCAYHFRERTTFLRQSFSKLAPGGRISLADICFSSSPQDSLLLSLFSFVGVIPGANIVTVEQYVRDLQVIGYVDVHVEDITRWVFPGFSGYLKSQRSGKWRLFGSMVGMFANIGARFIIATGTKPEH